MCYTVTRGTFPAMPTPQANSVSRSPVIGTRLGSVYDLEWVCAMRECSSTSTYACVWCELLYVCECCAGVMMIINCNWTFNHQDHCEASSPAQWQAKSGITGAHSSLRFGSSPSPGGKQCRQQKPFPSNQVSIWKGKEDAQVLSFKALNEKQRK